MFSNTPQCSVNLPKNKLFHTAKNFQLNSNPARASGTVSYSFLFCSWVAPHVFFNKRLKAVAKKHLLGARKVYLLLTWIYYLTFNLKRQDKNKRVSFALLPSKKSKYTLTKAPMAHKTFSKEQFKFQRYSCRVTIRVDLSELAQPSSFAQLSSSLLVARNSFPVLETNILFLKNCEVCISGSAAMFYSYYRFRLNRHL